MGNIVKLPAASYHLILVPERINSFNVGGVELQKTWVGIPDGALGLGLITTVTAVLEVLSHPLTVWEA